MSDPVTETFVLVRCANCLMPFYLTTAFVEQRRKDHQGFMCPIGHLSAWQQSEDQRTKEQLRATIQSLQEEIITLREVRKDAEHEPQDWRQKLGLRS